MRLAKSISVILLILLAHIAEAQVIWQDNLNNNCASLCTPGSYNGWTVQSPGTNGTTPNKWYISCAEEGGHAANECGTNCSGSGDATLHIGNDPNSPLAALACPSGDCGASYDGGYIIAGVPQGDVTTDTRAVTPTINCSAYNGTISVSFLYMESGDGSDDNFTLEYSPDNGATWSQLSDPGKTSNSSCGAGIGKWTAFNVPLPASAKSNANVKLGFRWKNNNDGKGNDPSVAIDNIVVCQESVTADFSASATTICVGDCVTFTDKSTSECGNINIWSWTFTGGSPANFIGRTPSSPICYNAAGSYTVQLYAANDHNIQNTRSQTAYITVKNCTQITADFTASPRTICAGECVDFTNTVTGGTKPYSYEWTFTGAVTTASTDSNPKQICYNTPGAYDVTLKVTDATGKTDTKTTTTYITVNSCTTPLVTNFSVNPGLYLCAGDCATFTDLSTSGSTIDTWFWTFNGGTIAGTTSNTYMGQNPPEVCFNTPGSYDVTLYCHDAANYAHTHKETIVVTNCSGIKPDGEPSDDLICTGSCISFTDKTTSTTGEVPVGWEWTFFGATPQISTAQNPTLICYPTEGIYPVKLKVYTASSVDSATLSFTIRVNNPEPVRTNFDSITIVSGTSQPINASGGVSYSWVDSPPGTLNTYSYPSVLATPHDTTFYTVVMTDATGCTSTKTIVVNVVPPNKVWAPNAFAPGGLPENKVFRIFVSGLVATIDLKIFDRWGELLFSTTDPNAYWDGTYKGVKVNSGVYVYYYKVTFQDGTEVKQSGDVTLLR